MKIFKKIFTTPPNMYPEFKNLLPYELPPAFINQLGNNIFYTPKIQKITYTEELVKYMAFLTRKRTVLPQDMRKFTQAILTQYGIVYKKAGIQDQKFGFQKNYKIQPEQKCPYHGNVDYMVYLNKHHFFPLLFFENQLNQCSGPALALSNMIMKSKLREDEKTSGYSLITNGQEWVMYKMYRSLKLEKSVIYEAKNNKFKNMYEDFEMTSVVLGLIDYCLEIQRPDVEALKTAYDFIDDQRFMIEAKEGQKIKNSPVGKVLTEYYKKQKDWDSK